MSETADLSDLPRSTREQLADLPPTATLVYLHLHNEDGQRQLQQIATETARPKRSIRRALRQLHDEGMVSRSPNHADPSSSAWSVDG